MPVSKIQRDPPLRLPSRSSLPLPVHTITLLLTYPPRRHGIMKRYALVFGILVLGAGLLLITAAYGDRFVYPIVWPEPPVVTPGENNAAPSDALVLYDGKNFDAWKGAEKWQPDADGGFTVRSEEHTSELQSPDHLVCRLLLEKKKKTRKKSK